MKKIMAFFLSFCLLISAGAMGTDVQSYTENNIIDYYMKLYYHGEMKDGPGDIIGDPTFNGTINACDALLALVFAVFRLPTPADLQQVESYCVRFYQLSFHKNCETKDWENDRAMALMWFSHPVFQCYTMDAYFLCDVTDDCVVNAEDALMILQYAVGKRDSFPRTDYSGEGKFQYMVWPLEWYPTMYFDLRTTQGEDAYDDIVDVFPNIPPVAEE